MAIEMIEKTLTSSGYPLVQTDKEIVQIIGVTRNSRTIGIPIISDPKDVPKGERIISYLFQSQARRSYSRPTNLWAVSLTAAALHVVPGHAGRVRSPGHGKTSVIRQLIVILAKIDAPPLPPPKEKRAP